MTMWQAGIIKVGSALALMLVLSSCSTFREYFDEDPAKAKTANAKAGAKADAAKKAPAQAAPAKRDEVIPDYFGTRKKDDYVLSSELTPAERASLNNTATDVSSSDIDAINRKNEEIKKKQHQSVYGF